MTLAVGVETHGSYILAADTCSTVDDSTYQFIDTKIRKVNPTCYATFAGNYGPGLAMRFPRTQTPKAYTSEWVLDKVAIPYAEVVSKFPAPSTDDNSADCLVATCDGFFVFSTNEGSVVHLEDTFVAIGNGALFAYGYNYADTDGLSLTGLFESTSARVAGIGSEFTQIIIPRRDANE